MNLSDTEEAALRETARAFGADGEVVISHSNDGSTVDLKHTIRLNIPPSNGDSHGPKKAIEMGKL